MTPIDLPLSGTIPLLLFLAKATLLLVVALLFTILLRRSSAGARHLVWLAVLVGVLALPLLSRIDSLRVGVLPSRLATNMTSPANLAMTITPPALPSQGLLPATSPVPAVAPVPPVPPTPPVALAIAQLPGPASAAAMPMLAGGSLTYSLLTIIAVIWAAITLALLGWLAAGAVAVRRIIDGARELTSPDWTTPLCEVADRLDLDTPPRLVLSDAIEMAFACGVLTPTIVLPANADSWSDDRRRAVLFHELAHVKRHDLLGHTLGRLACALYWFHPLVWTAAKNLRAESERACDDLVLSCGARPSEYAQHLLDMVTSVRRHGAPVTALPMARKKEFEGRMLAILDPAVRRASPGRMQAAAVIATVGVLSLTVAAAAPASERVANAHVDHVAPPAPPTAVALTPPPATMRVKRVASPEPAPMPAPTTDPSPSPSARPHIDLDLVTPTQLRVQATDTGRIALLIRVLSTDSDAGVRRTAAWALQDIRSSDVLASLIKALHVDADWSVREMAAWALAEHPGDDAVSALSDGLHDKNARVRATSAWSLGQLEARREVGSLENAVSDEDVQVRELAIWAIGQMNVKTVPRPIVNALTDASPKVRLIAAWAIGEIADQATADAVIKAFQTETSTQVRSAEMRALVEMGKTSQTVLDIALKSSDPDLRRRAVAMLAGSDNGSWPWPWPWPWPRPSP
jgi:beta-lactamase regulating signal transducer with metallopeptidase domain/HEAT repeat protein